MQLYAFDTNNCRKSVHNAEKKQDFFCMECGQVVRRRSGLLMQPHFYHLNPKKKCSMENKSLEHIEIQKKIVAAIGENKAEQEVRFLEISRVADVCWHEKQIVFEVQCSPITLEELVQRTSDYEKVGYYVIWILLDSTFLYKDKMAIREYLEKRTHYFATKEAIIFDYMPGIYNAVRAFAVDVSTIQPFRKKNVRKELKKRANSWKYYAKQDLLFFSEAFPEKKFLSKNWGVKRAIVRFFRNGWRHLIFKAYCLRK